MQKLAFHPSRHGYHFTNAFVNRILPGVLNGVQTSGLCGGMCMSALDYWRAGVPIPTHQPSDFTGIAVAGESANLPSETSRLRAYIYERQMHSLLTSAMFTRWITAPWIRPRMFHDWAIGNEFEIVRNQILQGRPAMIGLWSMQGGPTSGHQVLAYGWAENPRRLFVYDPNRPNEECVLQPVSARAGVTITGETGAASTYRGYFFTDVYNWNQNPPLSPPYRDLVIQEGITIGTATNPGNIGSALSASVRILNSGDSRASFKNLFIWVRGPNGENFDTFLGGAEAGRTTLEPGESHLIVRQNSSFATFPGTYSVGVSYLSNQGHWINIPALPGATNSAQVSLFAPKRQIIDTAIRVPESTSDVDTGITLQTGDEFSIEGSGQIWAGVLFTGTNGPEGWLGHVERNPGSPINNRADAIPYSLIGKFQGEGYFLIGRSLSRRSFNGGSAKRLFLRINDNVPANGSGQFDARVRVWR